MEKDVRNTLVKKYRLSVECRGRRYSLIDLRNAIAHGKVKDKDLSFKLTEKNRL